MKNFQIRYFWNLSLLLFLTLAQGTPAAGQEEPPSFRIDARYIKVPVTVLGEKGEPLLGLTASEFELFDEGEPRIIENFVLDRLPIHVVLLLDTSGSVREELEAIRDSAFRFAQAFDSEDRIAVIAFSDEIKQLQDWTSSHRQVRRALGKLETGYRTALYDALLVTAQEKLKSVPGKKVIILLTDGLDNASTTSYDSVLSGLVRSGTALYIVSRTRLVQARVQESERVDFLNSVLKNVLDDEKNFVDIYFQEKEISMNHLAETTGGRALFPEHLASLGETYLQIARELKNQYILTFRPPARSQEDFRSIEVLCHRPITQIFHRTLYRFP